MHHTVPRTFEQCCYGNAIAASHSKNFDAGFAIQVALLHDVLEDTTVTAEELAAEFGTEVTTGVLALTKNKLLPKTGQMNDSLIRLKTFFRKCVPLSSRTE